MKISLTQTLILLYILTVISALVSRFTYGIHFFVTLILGVSAIKFLLVFYRYMEMYKAHPFWKWFTVVFLSLFIVVVSIILYK